MSADAERAPQPLSPETLAALLRLAAHAVRAAVLGQPLPRDAEAAIGPALGGGAFVTLHRAGQLAGCVGYVSAPPPLSATVVRAARAAALDDPRFDPVAPQALAELHVEISVLSDPAPIDPAAVIPGVHGLMLEHQGRRGLLLPQVATEHHLGREAFLRALCDKAGVSREAWRDAGATLLAFSAQVKGAPLRELTLGERGRG